MVAVGWTTTLVWPFMAPGSPPLSAESQRESAWAVVQWSVTASPGLAAAGCAENEVMAIVGVTTTVVLCVREPDAFFAVSV